jgi:hypothetical protein
MHKGLHQHGHQSGSRGSEDYIAHLLASPRSSGAKYPGALWRGSIIHNLLRGAAEFQRVIGTLDEHICFVNAIEACASYGSICEPSGMARDTVILTQTRPHLHLHGLCQRGQFSRGLCFAVAHDGEL